MDASETLRFFNMVMPDMYGTLVAPEATLIRDLSKMSTALSGVPDSPRKMAIVALLDLITKTLLRLHVKLADNYPDRLRIHADE